MITILPPGPEDPALRFDLCQFSEALHKIGDYAKELTRARLSFNDHQRMGTVSLVSKEGKKRWIPKFAASDEQLRAVLLRVGSSGAGGGALPWITDWRDLDARCTTRILSRSAKGLPESQKPTVERLQQAVKKAGSYLALYLGVAYHYWREAEDCVTVAEILDMTPVQVRMYAQRMVVIARELGFETYEPHPTAGREKSNHAVEARRATLERHYGNPAQQDGKLRNAARRDIRQRLYGSPEFDETKHCWDCRIALKKFRWLCEPCKESRRQRARCASR